MAAIGQYVYHVAVSKDIEGRKSSIDFDKEKQWMINNH